jgi:tRNA (guanine-N7-)-methyltransferase
MPPDLVSPVPVQSSLIYPLRSIVERLALTELFPECQPLEVELGSGDGSFIVEWARRHPEKNFLAVERLLGRLRKVDRKGQRAGLTNLRAIRIEAAYCLEYLLPAESVNVLHVYFPDPWPKRKHRRHRLVNEHFTEVAKQVLAPGGVIYLRTDDADYFAQITAVFGANASFQTVAAAKDLEEMLTDFEREFHARGVATLRAAYRAQ